MKAAEADVSHCLFIHVTLIRPNGGLIELKANSVLGPMKMKSYLGGLFWPPAVSVVCRLYVHSVWEIWQAAWPQRRLWTPLITKCLQGWTHDLRGCGSCCGYIHRIKAHVDVSWWLIEKLKHRTSERNQILLRTSLCLSRLSGWKVAHE